MSKYDYELKRIQQQYLAILQSFSIGADDEEYYYQVCSFIDKCELFWVSKRAEVLCILDDISANEKCVLLSGAVYLDVDGNGHYAFGAIGDRNIINDPVLRMKGYFINNGGATSDLLKKYFFDAVSDTVTVLEKYSDYFIVLSIDSLMSVYAEENRKLGEEIYWAVLSSSLKKDVRSLEALKSEFKTLDELENALGDAAQRFILNDLLDVELTLGSRVKKWYLENKQMSEMTLSNEIDQFFIASTAQIQQASDILLKCSRFNLYPYIRFEVSLQYFVLIAGAFPDDESLKRRIEYALISFLFDNYIVPESINGIDFNRYCQLCKRKKLGSLLRDAVFSDGGDFLKLDLSNAVRSMMNVYITEIQNDL